MRNCGCENPKFTRKVQISTMNYRFFHQIKKLCVGKSVFVSQSNDIFTNLALEDWLYQNYDFKNQNMLMLWQNDPCVVIGRHQNPWVEANIENLIKNNILLARRNSGGGTVFHDRGNLNMTFFSSRDRYKRKENLEIISRAVFKEYGLKIEISKREDLVYGDFKVSGTASKLGRENAYHHCTLLVDVDKSRLKDALFKEGTDEGIKSNATKSIKSKVLNLREVQPEINIDDLLWVISNEFLNLNEGKYLGDLPIIDPNELQYPGLGEMRENLESWNWVFGKTPKFGVTKTFTVPNASVVCVEITVEHGKISEINVNSPDRGGDLENLFSGLKGREYSNDVFNFVENVNTHVLDSKFVDCV